MPTALIFGSTGLTGKALLNNLLNDERYTKVYLVLRNRPRKVYLKVDEFIFDFKDFETLAKVNAQHIFCCLGTTLKKAGSKEAQQIIDRDYPIAIAKYASEIKAEKLICVSSVGANSKSNNFYLKTKGEMEEGVKANFANAIFVRPSFLFGSRNEVRFGENLGIALFYVISPFLTGRLSKYAGVHVDKLSKAMTEACFKNTKSVLHYDDFYNEAGSDFVKHTK